MSLWKTAKALLAALDEAGVPRGVIAKKLAIAPSAVSALYSEANTRRLQYDEAVKLMALLPSPAVGRELPLIGMAGAGQWVEAIERAGETVWAPAEGVAPGKFVVEIDGESMNRILPHGSKAIVDPDDRDLYVGRIYLLLNDEGEATVKRYRNDPARFEPVSDDPTFVPFLLGSTDFRVVGRITAAIQIF